MADRPGTDMRIDGTDERRIHVGEWRAVALSFAYFFCVLAAYYVIRPVRDQLSAAVGSTQLPWFYAATFAATLALTPVFAWLVARYPRRIVVPIVYGFFIACLLAFVPLFTAHGLLSPRALGTVFFVWISVFNLFVVSVFWSFMADIWSNDQARRLFPIIALGGTAGAVAGPLLTRQLVAIIGVPSLLVVSASLLGVALVCVALLGQWARLHGARRYEAGHEGAIGGSMFEGLKQIFANPFMRNMALLLLLGDCIGTVNYALVIDYSGATFTDAVSRTRFAAGLDLLTNSLQVIVQLTLTRWMLTRFGAGPAIGLWASVTFVVLLIVLLVSDPFAAVANMTPAEVETAVTAIRGTWFLSDLIRSTIEIILTVPWVGLALIVSRGLAYGMLGPARESLFTRVPRSERYKGKNAVDTAVWRFGDLSVALSMNGLRALGVAGAGFAAFSATAAALAGVLGWRLARRVEAQVEPIPAVAAAP